MGKRFGIIIVLLLMVALPSSAIAGEFDAKINYYVESSIRAWLSAPELIKAVVQQNIDHMGLTNNDIAILDSQWKAGRLRLDSGGSLVKSKLRNKLAYFLRGVKAASAGKIVEIFVMDNKGLNVGQTDPTGDYMQGDEAKWKKTYKVSAYAVLIDDVEEEGGIKICQTSLTVALPNGAPIGAVTIALNVDKL